MVEIIYKPIKELIIMERVRYEKPEVLASSLAMNIRAGHPVALLWCEGIVFFAVPLSPDTDSVAQEYLKGRVLWSSVVYAPMPSYQPMVKVGTIEVPVMDVSPNPTMQEVARWLKETTKSD